MKDTNWVKGDRPPTHNNESYHVYQEGDIMDSLPMMTDISNKTYDYVGPNLSGWIPQKKTVRWRYDPKDNQGPSIYIEQLSSVDRPLFRVVNDWIFGCHMPMMCHRTWWKQNRSVGTDIAESNEST